MTSAERIRILREGKGLSQNDLAVKLGLSRSSISMYEAGERVPSTYVFQSMADLFEVDLDYVMGRSGKTTILPECLDCRDSLVAQSALIKRAIGIMCQLNHEGQSRVADYADDLRASGNYNRDSKIVSLSPMAEELFGKAQIVTYNGAKLKGDRVAEILMVHDGPHEKQEENNK